MKPAGSKPDKPPKAAAPARAVKPAAPRTPKTPRGAKAFKHPVPQTGVIDDLIAETLEKTKDKRPKPAADPVAERQRQRETRNAEVDARLAEALKKAVAALLDKKAEKVVVLRLEGITSMSDYFVLASATNERQAQALADAVEEAMKKEERRPYSVEGYHGASWILLDYGDVVFHVFQEEARRFYALERLWGDAPDETPAFTGA